MDIKTLISWNIWLSNPPSRVCIILTTPSGDEGLVSDASSSVSTVRQSEFTLGRSESSQDVHAKAERRCSFRHNLEGENRIK
jgi:hypothetical protein